WHRVLHFHDVLPYAIEKRTLLFGTSSGNDLVSHPLLKWIVRFFQRDTLTRNNGNERKWSGQQCMGRFRGTSAARGNPILLLAAWHIGTEVDIHRSVIVPCGAMGPASFIGVENFRCRPIGSDVEREIRPWAPFVWTRRIILEIQCE